MELLARTHIQPSHFPLPSHKQTPTHQPYLYRHTSASLTINENADPDVRTDMETFLSNTVPEGSTAPWIHTDEGYDDMPAHCKSSMMGCSVTMPITNGRLNVGTWQGVWLCEHRDHGGPRQIVITIHGE